MAWKCFLLLVLLVWAGPSSAAGWKQESGIGGGYANSFAASATDVCAATADGLYCTLLGVRPAAWRPLGLRGIALTNVARTDSGWVAYSVGQDPANPGYTVYASKDEGASWKETPRTGSLKSFGALGSEALILNSDIRGGDNTLLASRDFGLTWARVSSPLHAGDCGWLKEGIACNADNALVLSRDHGVNWEPLASLAPTVQRVFGGGFLYARVATGEVSKIGGDGVVWTATAQTLGSPKSIDILSVSDSLVLLSINANFPDESLLAGRGNPPVWTSYRLVNDYGVYVNDVAWAGGMGYVSTKASGVFSLTLANGEARFDPFDQGLTTAYVWGMQADGDLIYACTDAGIWRKGKNQDSWSVYSRPADPPTAFFAAGDAGFMFKRARPFATLDDGKTWTQVTNWFPGAFRTLGRIGDLFLATADTSVYVPISDSVQEHRPRGDIYQATSLLGPWTLRGSAGRAGPTTLVVKGTRIFGIANGHLLVSPDSGRTWNDTLFTGRKITALAADADGVYAGDDSGAVRVSRDGGATWASLAISPAPKTRIVALAAGAGKAVLATGSADGRTYAQAIVGDSGTWSSMETQAVPGTSTIVALGFLDDRLYAATDGSGVFSFPSDPTVLRPRLQSRVAARRARWLSVRGSGKAPPLRLGTMRQVDGKILPIQGNAATQWLFVDPGE